MIFCSSVSSSRDDGRPSDGFAVRELDPVCLADPVMKLLLHKVCQMGRSVELLVNLDRISDLWDAMDKDKGILCLLVVEPFKAAMNCLNKKILLKNR